MATMAVLNHTDEELDDDIVSNLSLNLMVSDNEDGGSPNSDRFDKLDSRNDSPEDSNNCDNADEGKVHCSDLSNNGMKDDLEQLRDVTENGCWPAVDDAESNDFGVDKLILTETENKETTSTDTGSIINEEKMEHIEYDDNTECIGDEENTERLANEDIRERIEDEDKTKSIEDEDNSKSVVDEDNSKFIEDEDNSKSIDDEDNSKSVDDEDNSKSVDDEDNSKSIGDEDNTKSMEDEDNTKSMEDEDNTKSIEDEDNTKSIEDEDNTKSTEDGDNTDENDIKSTEGVCENKEENNSPSTEEANEHLTMEEDSHQNDHGPVKETEQKDVEMENEDLLLNDVRDTEKDSSDCENLDEDALLSDPRDEDLLQITEEKSTENDTADFLKSCQEEQEANDNSCSSADRNEDNQSECAGEYEESNTDSLDTEPTELEDTVTNGNDGHSDIDNDTNDVYDLNLVQSEDGGERQEGGSEESSISINDKNQEEIAQNEESVLHSENNSNKSEISSMENADTSTDIVDKQAALIETEEHTEVIKSKGTVETSDDIDQSMDAEESGHHEANETLSETLSNATNPSNEVDPMSDKYCDDEISLCDTQVSTKHIIITNVASCGDEEPVATSDDVEQSIDAEEVPAHEKEMLSSVGQALVDSDAIIDETRSTCDFPNESYEKTSAKQVHKVCEDVPEADLPSDDFPKEDRAVSDETKQLEQTQSDAIMKDQVEENERINNAKDNINLETVDVIKDNEDSKEADSASAIAEVDEGPTETVDEPMEVDDMELDAEPLVSTIESNALCITKDIIANDLPTKESDQTNEAETVATIDVVVKARCLLLRIDPSTDNKKYDSSIVNVDAALPDNTMTNTAPCIRAIAQDENIINLIDDSEPEPVAVSAAHPYISNLQAAQIADVVLLKESTTETTTLESSTNDLHISYGIEGDNKECEDMDIEEITPYKESATRLNGSVLKQILVSKNTPTNLSSISALVTLPSADGKQNTKRLSNTITDNNIAVVSPQPGDKRLSSDSFQLDSAKRRRLAATPASRETRQKYLESFKQSMAATNWSKIGRRELEEFVTQKILEAIHYKTEMGQLQKKCMEYKQSLENLRTNSLTIAKQLRDMNSVHIKLEREINMLKIRHRDDDKPLVAVKITRSVGLQAVVDEPKVNNNQRRTRVNIGSARTTNVQKQQAPVVHQQQQQQPKPTNQQQQPQTAQVQQRVAVGGTNTIPQLLPRPARTMATVPPVTSPVQTRTMSRNKKVSIASVVSNTTPPPLRSINPQQSVNALPSTPTSIPIKHVTGPTILNKNVGISKPPIAAPTVTTSTKEVPRGVIDLTDEDDIGKKVSSVKTTPPPQIQQQQRITLMSTVVNGQQVLLRVDGGGPLPAKTATALSNYVQSSPQILQQRVGNATNAVKIMPGVPLRSRTSSTAQTINQQQQNNTQTPASVAATSNNIRRFRHPAPLPAPPASQSLIKGNKPIPPKPTVTVNKSPNGSGIIVKWNMPSMLSLFEKIVRYELFVYQVTKSPPRTDSWGKINDVGALDLPMAVSLTEFAEGNRYYFAVRAVDELSRLGPFSEPQTIVF